jgi:hypothetical protein
MGHDRRAAAGDRGNPPHGGSLQPFLRNDLGGDLGDLTAAGFMIDGRRHPFSL